MIVRLKETPCFDGNSSLRCFNSMIVRLKAARKIRHAPCPARFNSMIVRLKASIAIHITFEGNPFQFYDSPIKSFRKQLECRSFPQFQFYDSPIKRLVFCKNENISFVFQFYDSPIKRPSLLFPISLNMCFNSMIVRLKVFPNLAHDLPHHVSIL